MNGASLMLTFGQTPMDKSFSFPIKRYFILQYLLPLGCRSRNKPLPSESFLGFELGLAFRTPSSVSLSEGNLILEVGGAFIYFELLTPNYTPF